MSFAYAGEIAALITAICFSIGPTFFTLAGQRAGAAIVNRSRLLIAALMLAVIHWFTFKTFLPLDAAPDRWLWLGLSGVVGLVIGDAFLFQALLLLGTRLTMLVFSISPVLAAILAWLFLNENLTFFQITGMIVTIAGVAWVVSEKNNGNNPGEPVRSNNWKGLLAALAGALGQAGGMILAKKGLGGDFPAISGHIIRLSTAALVIWVMAFFQGQAKTTVMTMKNKSGALRFTTLGVLFGPLVGVWFSLIAIQATSVGIATTLMALPPIFLLPIGYFIFKERISPRAIVGTLVALAGVAMLFLI